MDDSLFADSPAADAPRWRDVFAAGGETGARIAAHDWAATPLGPVAGWPQSLRTALTLCLHSPLPTALWWGPAMTMLHNDAYQPLLGRSGRDALGRSGPEVAPDTWPVVGPVLTGVLAGRGPIRTPDEPLLVERDGFPQECHLAFAYSPVVDETGAPAGVLTTVTESTDRVVGARRLRTLGDLAAGLADAGGAEEVGRRVVKVLAENRADVPFVRLYLAGDDDLRLLAASGSAGVDDESWPLAATLADGATRLLPVDPADDPERPGTPLVALAPVPEPGDGPPTALLVVGLNPHRPLDDGHRAFVELVAGSVGTALAGARAQQAQRRRAEAPGPDGFGLLAAIRARPETAHLPVVLLSARSAPEAAAEGLAAGADDYLVKPFPARALLARVRANVDRTASRLRHGAWAHRLVGAGTDGIFVADEHGVVLQVNDAWTKLLGYGPQDAPYRPPYPWWPDPVEQPDERAVLDRSLVDLLAEGAGTYEVPLRHRDGRWVWVSISATTVWDPTRQRTLLLGTVRDVTEDRALAERHRAAAALADELVTAGDVDGVAAIAIRAWERAFAGRAYLMAWGDDGETTAYTSAGPVGSTTLDPEVVARLLDGGERPPGSGEDATGLGGRLQTSTAEWCFWVRLPAPRPLRAEEHLLAGLLAAVVGQALRRVEAVARQDAVTADLRGAVREATERERAWRAEAAARADQQRADRRFRSLVEASSAVVWAADATGAIGEPQPSWEAYTGQRWPGYAGFGWTTMVHPDDAPHLKAQWREGLAAGTPLFEFEGRLWHAGSDTHRHVAVRAASLRDATGTISEWIGTIYDTDDQVRAEERARRTAAISEALLDTSPVGFGWVDPQLRYRYVNPALAAMNGRPVAAHLGRRPGEVLPAHGEQVEELLRRSLAHGPISGVELSTPDGGPADGGRHLVASYFPIRIAHSQELVGVGFALVDVTERTRLAQALGEQRARYERLAATDVLAVFGGTDERITEANEAFLTMLGYTPADVAEGRLSWPELTPPGWDEVDLRAQAELATTGRARAYVKEYLHRDGHRVPVQIGMVALERDPVRWIAYATDLSAERTAQAELRLFQALVERSGDFIAVAAPDGRVVYVNPAGREFVGLAGDAPLDRLRLLDFAAPEVRPAWRRELIPTARREGHHRTESRLVRLDTGERRDVDHQTFTVTAGDGAESTAFLAAVARDIGDRQRALRQAEALARLAGALSTAPGRAEVAAAVTAIAPDVLDGARVRLATAAPGGPVLAVTDPSRHERLDVDADVPLARAVRDNEVVTLDGSTGTTTGLCVPLRYGDGGPLGAVEAHWDRPVTDDEALRNLLDTVAGLCGQALQRAELSRSARAMAEFAARLSVTRSTAEAIEVILTAVPVALGAARPTLAVREDGHRIRLHHAGPGPVLAAGHDDVDGPGPVAVALRTGERIVLPDRAAFAARFPDLADVAGAEGLVTTVALPLLDALRRPFAVLSFGWSRVRPFREGDLALLDTIADLCEQTLERVRLAAAEHNLVTRLAGRLRTSSRPAPASLAIATRYQPAVTGLNLGGDWYDLIRLDGDRLAVVVGDVVGHRVEAAADMAQLRTMVNTLIRTGVPLGEVFPRLTDLVGSGFLGTCLAMVVEPEAGRVLVARAGHPHLVVARRRRRPVAVETEPSLPLGMVRETMILTAYPFEPGDLLVAYTDGLVERRDQLYDTGVTALRRVVSAHRRRSVERIADALLTELGGSDDDQALVVIRHVGDSTVDGRCAAGGRR